LTKIGEELKGYESWLIIDSSTKERDESRWKTLQNWKKIKKKFRKKKTQRGKRGLKRGTWLKGQNAANNENWEREEIIREEKLFGLDFEDSWPAWQTDKKEIFFWQ
jgi:hypothetical protein